MATLLQENSIFHLGQLISQSLATLQDECALKNLSLPDLDSTAPASGIYSHPAAAHAAKVVASACLQLAASLMPANEYTFSVAVGDYRSTALRVCLEANVTEILREAGHEGLHVQEISKRSGIEANKLGRLLRYLSTHYIYREVSPDVFTNNKNSAVLDTGKSLKEIIAEPQRKYDSTSLPALCSHHLDILSKSSISLSDVIAEPAPTNCTYCRPSTHHRRGSSTSASLTKMKPTGPKTAFGRGMKTDLSFWQFMDQSENLFRRRKFGFAMNGMAAIQPPDVIFRAFDWASLPPESLVVDVGGGIGIPAMAVAQRHGDLNIVVQDLEKAVEAGERFWKEEYPEALDTGRVRFEVQDFRLPQPSRMAEASVFLLKNVLHNWQTADIIKILTHLRHAASPETKLVIIDGVVPYACQTPAEAPENVPGSEAKGAPAPLLPNYGAVADQFYWLDLTMMYLFDGQEPTVRVLQDVLAASGWNLVSLRSVDPQHNFVQSVEAVPM